MSDRAPEHTQRIADRLATARRARFVGRRAERDLFSTALLAATPPFAVLYVHGPGGIGKTTLLREYAHLAATCSRPVIYLDARNIAPAPPDFLRALRQQLGQETSDPAPLPPAWPTNGVLLLDTYEALAPLDPWLRESFLPQLPARSLVVIASRAAPSPAWRTDLAWGSLTRVLPLGYLLPAESREYLASHGIPRRLQADVLAFTQGHPLALALVADVLRQGELPAAFHPETTPDVVRVLLEQLIQHIPSPQHRLALEICVLAWATTESLLADLVEGADAPALFAWLRDLSFIAQGPYGLFPHDLVRAALVADLRWRNPSGYEQLIARLVAHLARQLAQTRQSEQPRLWMDMLALTRQHPAFQSYFDWNALGTAYAEPAAPGDHPEILAMVAQHEGSTSASIAAYWLQRQPEAFLVFRDAAGTLLGFMAQLRLAQAVPDDVAADPAMHAAWQFVANRGPLREGEELLYLRFWMSRDAHQGVSPALNLTAIHSSIAWTTHPCLAWSLIATHTPAFHELHFSSIGIHRASAADFAVDGHRYGAFARDWRIETVAEWLTGKIDLATPATSLRLQPPASPTPARAVLTRQAFDAAVRQALRDYTRPDRLAANPLVKTQLVAARASQKDASVALQELLRDAIAMLQATPRERKFYHALWHTYIEPAPTQEQAAERLDLPFNTYRYRLAQGVARVTSWLWQREIDRTSH